MTQVILQESGCKFDVTDKMLVEMSKYGDVPADWGLGLDEVVWVSVDYARTDPHWSDDIPEGYPDHLPLWESR